MKDLMLRLAGVLLASLVVNPSAAQPPPLCLGADVDPCEAARIAGAEKSRALTYRNGVPDFSFTVGPIRMVHRIAERQLMLELNIPRQQTSRRDPKREAEAMVSAAQSRQQAALQRALGELGSALGGLQGARQSEHLATSSLVPQVQATFEAALAAYETGRVDFATRLEAQRQLRQACLSAIRAQAKARMRLAEVERLIGEDS